MEAPFDRSCVFVLSITILQSGKKFVKVEEKKEKTVYDDEFEKLLAEAEGMGDGDITDGDIDALAGQ